MTVSRDERRVHPRIARSIELSGAPASGGVAARLVASNLSLGGVYCTSDRDFPEMTRLGVRLELSRHEALELPAIVVRRKRLDGDVFELALLFSALSAVQRELLSHFLSQS